MKGGCGMSSPVPLAHYDPTTSSWRTFAVSFPLEGVDCSDRFSETWPQSGMTRDGSAYALPTWERRTDGFACSFLLPTPRAAEADHPGRRVIDPRHHVGLAETLNLLPTPQTSDTNGPGEHGTGGEDLRTAVSLLPTPTSRDGKGPNQRQDKSCLHGALLPTPAVNDMGEGKTPEAWDEWTAKMQTSHANGNGHGKSLAIEAMRLLPTSKATNNENQCSEGWDNLGTALQQVVPTLRLKGQRSRGASTSQPSDDGNASSSDQPQHLPNPGEPATRS